MIKRIEWIDITKGLGMILVILGHVDIPNIYLKYILSFHMPLFFLLSGVTFNYYEDLNIFIKKN